MSFTSILTSITSTLFDSLAPYHLLLYSTLLGSSLYQTFINTKVCFNALPRTAFRTLQKRIFPIYFRSQLVLILLSALTVPPYGINSLREHKADWILYFVTGVTTGLNLVVFEPRTKKAMVECAHQETRDARLNTKEKGEELMSDQMRRLKRTFAWNHAMTIHLNLISIGAIVVYGWRLAGRMTVQ